MNRSSHSTDDQISEKDLATLSVEELEELLLRMYSTLEETFHIISGYAQGTNHIEAPFLSVIGLENTCKQIWEEIKATVNVLICHAMFAEFNQQQWTKIIKAVREENAFLQGVTPDEDINSEWLARRDALVAQTALLIEDVDLQEEIRQWVSNDQGTSSHLWNEGGWEHAMRTYLSYQTE